ncbi:MAG TPA: hypothetical protein PLN33_04300 [Hyphomonadaceae bacterium]|nr:hypothetical protein [Hyphomonadaceae bacterium]
MLRRWTVIIVLALVLSACGQNYPHEWPGISKPWFSTCPDLTGSYRIARIDADGRQYEYLDAAVFAPEPTVRGRGVRWDIMTVSGNIDEALSLRFTRSPELVAALQRETDSQRMDNRKSFVDRLTPQYRWSEDNRRLTDAQFTERLHIGSEKTEITRTLRFDVNYNCVGGWMGTDDGSANSVRDDGAIRSMRSLPEQEIGRDRSGGLIVHRTEMVEAEIPIWCGDHCVGIPLGTTTQHRWNRADSVEAPIEPVTSVPAQPWLADYEAAEPHALTPSGPAARRIDEARKLILARLPNGVTLVDLQPAGIGVRAHLSASQGDALNGMFDTLRHSDHGRPSVFYNMTVESFERASPTGSRIQLWMELPPAEVRLSREQLRLELLTLLPKQILVTYYGSGRGKYTVSIESPSREPVSTLLRNLDASLLFEDVNLLVTAESATKVQGDITFSDRQ